jgi:hypothetical protein
MFRGREFEIFDEPEPGAAAALGREREQPEPEARLGESDEPAATREPNGDPALAGRWARSAAAVATLAATAATVAMLLPRGADHGDGSRAADQEERAPLAQRPGRVQKAVRADVPSSRARPRAKGRRPARRRPRSREGLAGPTPPVAPSPPAVAQVTTAPTPPPAPTTVPAPSPPPPRPADGPTRVPAGDLPALAAPKSPFEP